MKARAKLIEGMAFLGEAGSGHTVVMDGAPEHGGRDLGFRPMELLRKRCFFTRLRLGLWPSISRA